jgi:transposase-like protein
MAKNDQDGRTRRRRHSAEFKAEAVAACMQPGVSTAAVALRYGLNANLLRTWVTAHEGRSVSKQAQESPSAPALEFIPLQLTSTHEPVPAPDIVIEIRRGASTVTVRWPQSAAADCADWLNGWLR